MNTCKTCKWHKPTPYDKHRPHGGWCECPKLHEDGCPPEGEAEYSKDHLVYIYNESGGFWTGDDFGCVHHRPLTRPT
jgi:hypothetical protein